MLLLLCLWCKLPGGSIQLPDTMRSQPLQAQLAAWQQQQHDLRLMALRRQYIQQHYAAVAAAAAAAAASAGDGGLSGGGPLQQGVPPPVTADDHRAGPLHQGLGGLAGSMQDSSLLHSSGAGSVGAEAGVGGLSAADAWAEAELLRNEREERSRLERELLKHVESMEVLPLSNVSRWGWRELGLWLSQQEQMVVARGPCAGAAAWSAVRLRRGHLHTCSAPTPAVACNLPGLKQWIKL